MKKVVLFVTFILVAFAAQAQSPQDSVSNIPQPTGFEQDTLYLDVVFALPKVSLSVSEVRYIVKYVTYPAYRQPIEESFERAIYRGFGRTKTWVKVDDARNRIIWSKRTNRTE